MTRSVGPPRNDGWTDRNYQILADEPALNATLSALLNEAWHVHPLHRDGNWNGPNGYKDHAARQITAIIEDRRSLIRTLLNFNDRVLSMLTYRAIELLDGPDAS